MQNIGNIGNIGNKGEQIVPSTCCFPMLPHCVAMLPMDSERQHPTK